jgi:hypothetical protein
MDLESWKRTPIFGHVSAVFWAVDPAGVGPREDENDSEYEQVVVGVLNMFVNGADIDSTSRMLLDTFTEDWGLSEVESLPGPLSTMVCEIATDSFEIFRRNLSGQRDDTAQ